MDYHTESSRGISNKADWTGYILRRNRLLKHVIQRKITGTEICGRCKQLLDDLNEKREDTGTCKRKHRIALRAELYLEDAMDQSCDYVMK